MQLLKWQQRQANLPLELEYVWHNAIACIIRACLGRSLQHYSQQPKQRKPLETSICQVKTVSDRLVQFSCLCQVILKDRSWDSDI
ncbi:MAG: hypothetical protein AB1589_35505 [Cyanobacteriota bacterium]